MSEVSRADDPAIRGSDPEPTGRRRWETPVLREIAVEEETEGKFISDIESEGFGAPGPS